MNGCWPSFQPISNVAAMEIEGIGVVFTAAPYERPCPKGCRMHHRTRHQVPGLRGVLSHRVVENRATQAAYVVEKRWAGDPAIIDANRASAGISNELLCVAIPRRPAQRASTQQHQGALGLAR